MNDERLDLELGELFHAAANVEIPDGLAARVAAIPGRRPARRGIGSLLFGSGLADSRPVGGGVRTRTSVPIGSLIVAALVVAGLIVVVPRVAPAAISSVGACTLRPAATTPAPTGSGPIATPTSLPATPSPVGPAAPTPTAAPGAFAAVGSMTTARYGATATLLNDGRVLIVGGDGDGGNRPSAELYDPASCTFGATGSMPTTRSGYSATLLKDGRILIVGGYGGAMSILASALLYDPTTGAFSPTGLMTTARSNHSATLLSDGRVLIDGGYGNGSSPAEPNYLTSAELYDPSTGTFSQTGSMPAGQHGSATALLPDGRVLFVSGGNPGSYPGPASAELYNPATGTFSPTGSMLAGWASSATVLQDGRVLVLGEVTNLPVGILPVSLPSAELYDPKTGTFSMTGSFAAPGGSATLLQDGHVLVLGGSLGEVIPGSGAVSTAQLYDPKAGTFAPTGSMTIASVGPTVTQLQDGRVLVAGGARHGDYLATAELFAP
jgi:Galactose oxidase, central domain